MSNLGDIIAGLDAERRKVIDDRAIQLISEEYQRQIDELVNERALLSLKLQMVWVAWQRLDRQRARAIESSPAMPSSMV